MSKPLFPTSGAGPAQFENCWVCHLLTEQRSPLQEGRNYQSPLSAPHLPAAILKKKMETVTDFIFLGSKISVDRDPGHKAKRCLLFGRKDMTNLCLVTQSRLTLCDPMDCIPPGTLVHGDSPGKNMTNLDIILKSRDITLPRKVHIVNAMVFPVVMYRCESWTMKKTECQRIDALELE